MGELSMNHYSKRQDAVAEERDVWRARSGSHLETKTVNLTLSDIGTEHRKFAKKGRHSRYKIESQHKLMLIFLHA